jgi:hypothetical protein
LSCLTKISSVFSLISMFFQAVRFCFPLVLICGSGLPLCFCFCLILFSDVFHIFDQFLLYISCFHLNSIVSLFIVSFVSLWYLFKSSLSSFICFCVFSCSLFLVFEISLVHLVHFD